MTLRILHIKFEAAIRIESRYMRQTKFIPTYLIETSMAKLEDSPIIHSSLFILPASSQSGQGALLPPRISAKS